MRNAGSDSFILIAREPTMDILSYLKSHGLSSSTLYLWNLGFRTMRSLDERVTRLANLYPGTRLHVLWFDAKKLPLKATEYTILDALYSLKSEGRIASFLQVDKVHTIDGKLLPDLYKNHSPHREEMMFATSHVVDVTPGYEGRTIEKEKHCDMLSNIGFTAVLGNNDYVVKTRSMSLRDYVIETALKQNEQKSRLLDYK